MVIPGLVAGHFEDCPVYKISEKDTNKFVLLCDRGQVPFVSFIEIFDVGGRTPSNEHKEAYEYFYVLKGEGEARLVIIAPRSARFIYYCSSRQSS